VLREKDLSRADRLALAAAIRDVLSDVQGRLLVASETAIPGDGVHLAASDPFPSPPPGVVGRSCHGPAALAAAAAEGCAYAFLSPVFATVSKPGYGPALGVGALAAAPLPVWALGGVNARNAATCVAAGAAGVAVRGEVMRAGDPGEVVTGILAAVAGAYRPSGGRSMPAPAAGAG
jgi:thiamine monophosphate synthase